MGLQMVSSVFCDLNKELQTCHGKCLELPPKAGGLLEKQFPIFVLGDIIIILQ
jgi:hypothetical protein